MINILDSYTALEPKDYTTCWRAPANIAFVKYWGKKGHQIPANPSLSMTLNECSTTTTTQFGPSDKLSVTLKLKGKNHDDFAIKIYRYLEGLSRELPWINHLSIDIETSNTFPHGAGIASSASGLSAFALTLTDYLNFLSPQENEARFFQQASYLSRLASGSACRSIYGGFVIWGESRTVQSSDDFATPIEVHPDFNNLHDTILVISSAEKNVSSTSGHAQMKDHFFAEARFNQAHANFKSCLLALKAGEFDEVGKILEAEALALHAMMLTSPTPYNLFRPNTIAAMDLIWAFRRETKLPLYFTLDAGPNLHLIYPDKYQNKIYTFITNELAPLVEKIIDDRVGIGPRKC